MILYIKESCIFTGLSDPLSRFFSVCLVIAVRRQVYDRNIHEIVISNSLISQVKTSNSSAILYSNRVIRLLISISVFLDLFEYFLSWNYFSKNNVFSVESRVDCESYEKLRIVCIGSLICHTKEIGLIMLYLKVFIFEGRTVYRLASCSVLINKVSSLSHKTLNDSVKDRPFVAETIGVKGKLSEIFCCFRYYFVKQFKLDPTHRFIFDWNVKKDIRFLFRRGRSHSYWGDMICRKYLVMKNMRSQSRYHFVCTELRIVPAIPISKVLFQGK